MLIQTLAVEMFEVVRINLMAEAGVGFRDQANWLGCWHRFGWSTGGWIVPEAAVLEDFADGIALAGLDEDDDFHGSAALRAEERVGVVDAFDEHGPAAAGEGWCIFRWREHLRHGWLVSGSRTFGIYIPRALLE